MQPLEIQFSLMQYVENKQFEIGQISQFEVSHIQSKPAQFFLIQPTCLAGHLFFTKLSACRAICSIQLTP
jgi:hypothetical protein